MSAEEFLYWILRIAIVLIFGTAVILIMAFLVPEVNANELRADVMSAYIANNGGFHTQPGIIDAQRFTQEIADNSLQYPTRADGSTTIRTEVGAQTWVSDFDGNVLLEPIIYNRPAYTLLNPQVSRRGVQEETRVLPATLTDGTPVLLHIRVVYTATDQRGRAVSPHGGAL